MAIATNQHDLAHRLRTLTTDVLYFEQEFQRMPSDIVYADSENLYIMQRNLKDIKGAADGLSTVCTELVTLITEELCQRQPSISTPRSGDSK